MKYRCFFLALLFQLNFSGFSQDLDSLILEDDIDYSILSYDSLLLDELDSLSIFTLLDSILSGDYRKSQLLFNLSYTSDVVNAGRDFGVNQQGLSPAISYFHKSGVFGSLSGYWNSQLDPKYSVTVASVGYLGIINSKLSYSFDYEHSFFANSGVIENDPLVEEVASILDVDIDEDYINPLTNNIGGGILADFGPLYSSLDYSFFFGKETAHRFEWRVVGDLVKRDFLFFDYVRLAPGVSVLFGNEEISTTRFNTEGAAQTQNLDRRQRFELAAAVIEDQGQTAFFRQLTSRQKIAYLQNEVFPIVDELIANIPVEDRSFGLMNYNFRLPVYFRKGKWGFNVSYNYNIPQELPGEDLDLSPSGYIGVGLSYYLSF